MFNKIEALDYTKHQNLRLAKIPSFAFAAGVSAVKLSFSELRQAARFYPIVFLKEAPGVPQALLSLEAGKNAFVHESGQWKVPYVPVFFRLYPFTLARIDAQADQFALCLDPDAEHFKPDMGDPLFTIDGTPTDFIRDNILKALQAYHREIEITQTLFNILEEKEVISDREFKYMINGEEKSIAGFRGVDMEKLAGLADADLAAMVKNGTIGMVHEHINSIANIGNFIAPSGAATPATPGQ